MLSCSILCPTPPVPMLFPSFPLINPTPVCLFLAQPGVNLLCFPLLPSHLQPGEPTGLALVTAVQHCSAPHTHPSSAAREEPEQMGQGHTAL